MSKKKTAAGENESGDGTGDDGVPAAIASLTVDEISERFARHVPALRALIVTTTATTSAKA